MSTGQIYCERGMWNYQSSRFTILEVLTHGVLFAAGYGDDLIPSAMYLSFDKFNQQFEKLRYP